MSQKGGVKLGEKRGKYNSKYKTDEERLLANKERCKQYYIRKKENNQKERSDILLDVKKLEADTKENEIKLLKRKLLVEKRVNIRLRKEIEELKNKLPQKIETIENIGESLSSDSREEQNMKDVNIQNACFEDSKGCLLTEDMIDDYERRRPHFKDYNSYDLKIEEILSKRGRGGM
jgi:hypothetical protein